MTSGAADGSGMVRRCQRESTALLDRGPIPFWSGPWISRGSALWCPGRDSNPHDQGSRDFKSLASTDFATRADESTEAEAEARLQKAGAGVRESGESGG